MQSYQKNTCKNPKPETPANKKIPIPLRKATKVFVSIKPLR